MTNTTLPEETFPGATHAAWVRLCSVALLAPLLMVVLACGPANVGFTFDNRSGSPLCEYPSPEDARGARCLTELDPNSETRGGRDCDGRNSRLVTVIITVKEDGQQIYNKTASCGEWEKSKGRFVIEQVGDDYVVTDGLLMPTPTP